MVGFAQDESTSKDMIPWPYQQMRQPVAQGMAPWLNWNTMPQYGEDFTSPMLPAEAGNLGNLGQMASGQSLEIPSERQLSDTLAGKYLDIESNPWLRGTYDAAARSVLDSSNEAFMGQRSAFTGQQQRPTSSSPMAAAESRLSRDRDITLANLSSQIFSPAYQNERQIQAQAAKTARDFMSFQFDKVVQNQKEQALPRLIEQYGLDKGTEMFNTRMQAFIAILSTAAGLTDYKSGSESSGFNVSVGPFTGAKPK